MVRTLRRVRYLCRGRGERRIARHGLRRRDAGQGARLRAGAYGAQPAHGAARQEPPLGHRLVDGQRGGHGAKLRGLLPLDQGLRRVASGALRTRRVRSGRCVYRHHLPDVLGLCAVREIPEEQPLQTADPVRIRACHGQLDGRSGPLLEAGAPISVVSGRIHLGLRRSGTRPLRKERPRVVPLRRRFQQLRRDRQFVQLQRHHRARPHVASARL